MTVRLLSFERSRRSSLLQLAEPRAREWRLGALALTRLGSWLSRIGISPRAVFANGANFGSDTEDLEHNPSAYVLLYLFITLGLFLILAQYFIAILVGAFDTAKEILKEEERSASKIQPKNQWQHYRFVLGQLLTGYSFRYKDWTCAAAMRALLPTRSWTWAQREGYFPMFSCSLEHRGPKARSVAY